MRDILGDLS